MIIALFSSDFNKQDLFKKSWSFRHADAELIDVSGESKSCTGIADFPYEIEEHTSFNLNGKPFVCGGFGDDPVDVGATKAFSDCYSYTRGESNPNA